ncbi:MAG: hypothetical protein CK425_03005 [Parachlamydia sp.]|nr:MAG: hypothetical protein CK425_03005 [Parachlamydia sp.]
MIKVLVKDVLNSYRNPTEHLYIYFNGREINLFKKGEQQKFFKKVSALTILRCLKKEKNSALLNLSNEETKKLRIFAQNIISKKENQSTFTQILSKLQNMITFKGFFTSKELAIQLLLRIKTDPITTHSQALNSNPDSKAVPSKTQSIPHKTSSAPSKTASTSPKKSSTHPRTPSIHFGPTPVPPEIKPPCQGPIDPVNPHPNVPRKVFIRNFATSFKHPSEPSSPFIKALIKELQWKGFPYVEENLEEIAQQAFHIFIEERIRKHFKEAQFTDIQPLLDSLSNEVKINFPDLAIGPTEVSKHVLDHLSTFLGASTKQKIQDYVHDFLQPYFLGVITRENEPKDRPALMDQLQASIQTKMPLTEMQQLALDAYFFESIRGMEMVLNRDSSHYNPLPPTSLVRVPILQALIPALAKDFPTHSMTETEILKKIDLAAEEYRLMKAYALQEVFEDFLDIEKMQLLRKGDTSGERYFNPNGCLYRIDQAQSGYDLYEQAGIHYIPLIKIGNRFYRTPLKQTNTQISFFPPFDMRESSYNSLFKVLGVKIYRPKQDDKPVTYYCVDPEGHLRELSMPKIESLIDLIKRIDYQNLLFGAKEYGLYDPELSVETELKDILYS